MVGLESPWHIAILVLVLVLVFGTKRLPEIGRSMGTGMREFKQSISSHGDEPSPPALAPGIADGRIAGDDGSSGPRDRDTIAH